MNNLYRTWCDINLDNLLHNINEYRKIVGKNTRLLGIIKANAYGHGAVKIAKLLMNEGFDYLAVACCDEAIQLRNHGITTPILILGVSPKEIAPDVIKYDITPTVFDLKTASAFSEEAVKQNKTAKIHIKLDTGMSRIGYNCDDLSTIDEIIKISKLKNINIEGIFSHFACADDDKKDDFTMQQFTKYMNIVNKLHENGINIPIKHICNSAAAIRFPNMHLDMVRLGISMYGFHPSDIKYDFDFKPVMQFKTTVTHIKNIKKDTPISYGSIFIADKEMKIATISVGYADGYCRNFTNKANVLINGILCPVVGKICMDQCMIDVSNVNNINIGDEVILFGTDKQGNTISIDELASYNNTINYELLCLIGNRVPRRYLINGKTDCIYNPLLN